MGRCKNKNIYFLIFSWWFELRLAAWDDSLDSQGSDFLTHSLLSLYKTRYSWATKFLVSTALSVLWSPTCTQRHHSVDTYPPAEALVASALGRGVAGAHHVATGLVSLVRIWERHIATKASFSFQYSQQGEKGVPLVVAITATPEWGKLKLQFLSVTETSVTVTK